MIVYRFKAYDPKGKIHTGNLFLTSEEEVISFLLRNNLTPIEVKLLPQSFFYQILLKLFFKITFKQKLFLIRSLYLILKSGLSLDKGLEILTKEAKGGLKDFLFYLSYNLQRGEPFYKTFAAFPQVFSEVEIETIKAGEVAGNLIENLEKLAENLDRQRQIRNEIISNIIYPAIVLLLAFGVIVLLITFVMPKISILLTQLTEKQPFLTRILIAVSQFVNQNLTVVTLVLILFFFLLIFVLVLKQTRNLLIKILMKMPIFSYLYLSLALSQVLFVLRSLLGSGLSLTQALRLAANSTFHPQVKKAFFNVEADIRTGKKFGDALLAQETIPVFLANILGIANETGGLEETLAVMENFYLEEFRTTIRNLLNLLQPVLLIFVGGIVGFVAIAILVPIYQQISTQLQFQEGRGRIPGQF